MIAASCSIGIAFAPLHGDTFHDLYHKADLALYHAKRLGKNRCYIYDNDSEESAEVELESKPAEEVSSENESSNR